MKPFIGLSIGSSALGPVAVVNQSTYVMIDLLRLFRKFRNDAQDICILLIHGYLSRGLFFHNCALMQYGSVDFYVLYVMSLWLALSL